MLATMNVKTRKSLFMAVAVMVLACIAFTLAILAGLASSRILALCFIASAVITGVLLTRAFRQSV